MAVEILAGTVTPEVGKAPHRATATMSVGWPPVVEVAQR
jgi:hypothetical protein